MTKRITSITSITKTPKRHHGWEVERDDGSHNPHRASNLQGRHPFRNETREVPRAQKTEHFLLPQIFGLSQITQLRQKLKHFTEVVVKYSQSQKSTKKNHQPSVSLFASWHQTPLATSKIRPAKRSGKPVAKETVSMPGVFGQLHPSMIHLPYDLRNLVESVFRGCHIKPGVSLPELQHGPVFKLCHVFMLRSHLSYSIHSRYLH